MIYLDPDIRINSALSELPDLARQHAIPPTPHTMQPFPADGREVDAQFILSAGVYNLGFIAVSEAARPFLEWWWASTRREALMDVARMMFTDQRVVDFVPALFPHHILTDPGCNVAYWNLHGRQLTHDAQRYIVDGRPLRFFHFSGFDVRRPWLLSRNQGTRPRILLSESPVVRALCREYAELLAAAGGNLESARAYGWSTLASGTAVTTRMRRVYWKALREAEQTGGTEPPNPFYLRSRCVSRLAECPGRNVGRGRFPAICIRCISIASTFRSTFAISMGRMARGSSTGSGRLGLRRSRSRWSSGRRRRERGPGAGTRACSRGQRRWLFSRRARNR